MLRYLQCDHVVVPSFFLLARLAGPGEEEEPPPPPRCCSPPLLRHHPVPAASACSCLLPLLVLPCHPLSVFVPLPPNAAPLLLPCHHLLLHGRHLLLLPCQPWRLYALPCLFSLWLRCSPSGRCSPAQAPHPLRRPRCHSQRRQHPAQAKRPRSRPRVRHRRPRLRPARAGAPPPSSRRKRSLGSETLLPRWHRERWLPRLALARQGAPLRVHLLPLGRPLLSRLAQMLLRRPLARSYLILSQPFLKLE